MGVRQELTELKNRPEGNSWQVVEEASGTVVSYVNGNPVFPVEMELSGGSLEATIVVSDQPPSDLDGRPDGTIYFQV